MADRSIHQRVVNGVTFHEKVNTAKPYKGGGKLARKQARLSTRRNDHSATIKSLPRNVPETAFRAPGSMNEHAR